MFKKIISSVALCLALTGASTQLKCRVRARTSPVTFRSDFVASHPVIQTPAMNIQRPVSQETAVKEKEDCKDCAKWAKALAVREKQLKEKKSTSWFSYLLPFILGFAGGTLNQCVNQFNIPGTGIPLRFPRI